MILYSALALSFLLFLADIRAGPKAGVPWNPSLTQTVASPILILRHVTNHNPFLRS
jgi:hypothetical protein